MQTKNNVAFLALMLAIDSDKKQGKKALEETLKVVLERLFSIETSGYTSLDAVYEKLRDVARKSAKGEIIGRVGHSWESRKKAHSLVCFIDVYNGRMYYAHEDSDTYAESKFAMPLFDSYIERGKDRAGIPDDLWAHYMNVATLMANRIQHNTLWYGLDLPDELQKLKYEAQEEMQVAYKKASVKELAMGYGASPATAENIVKAMTAEYKEKLTIPVEVGMAEMAMEKQASLWTQVMEAFKSHETIELTYSIRDGGLKVELLDREWFASSRARAAQRLAEIIRRTDLPIAVRGIVHTKQPEESKTMFEKQLNTVKKDVKEMGKLTARRQAGRMALSIVHTAVFKKLPLKWSWWARVTGKKQRIVEHPLTKVATAASAYGILVAIRPDGKELAIARGALQFALDDAIDKGFKVDEMVARALGVNNTLLEELSKAFEDEK